MVAPDDDSLDLRERRPGFLAHLSERTVVIEARHRGEPLRRQARRVALSDQRVGIRGVSHDEYAHVAARDGVERLALRRENLGVLEQQLLALHPGSARPRADQHRDVAVLERAARVVRRRNLVERAESAIVELHHHALHRGGSGGYFQQIEIDRLVGPEHLTRGDAKRERIADVSRGAGDRDGDWLFHGTTLGQKQQMVAEDGCTPHPAGSDVRRRGRRASDAPPATKNNDKTMD